LQSGSITIKDGGNNGQGTLNLGSTNGYFIQGGADYTAMNFYTNATQRLTILAGGNVLIGNSTDNGAKLQVGQYTSLSQVTTPTFVTLDNSYAASSTQAGDKLKLYLLKGDVNMGFGCGNIGDLNAWSDGIFRIYTGGSERMRITSGGAVLVNATSELDASAKFQVNGNVYLGSQPAGAGNSTLKYTTSTGAVTFDSSARIFKKDIVNLEYGLDSVLKMQPKKYKWKLNDSADLGFIADEMYEVIPEIVYLAENKINKSELKDGEPMGINYDRLIPVLVKAIQELEARIKQLENK
jgi:hypothetical protein